MMAYCEAENPEATYGRYDRADSGNYTLNMTSGTVLHEVGHALGLPDEYHLPGIIAGRGIQTVSWCPKWKPRLRCKPAKPVRFRSGAIR